MDYVFIPSYDAVRSSNIARFMDAYGIRDYKELIERSSKDIEWYWDAVSHDLNIEWFKHYSRDKILDVSDGIEWARWFVDGKCNIAYNCLEKHIKDGKGSRPAIVWENEQGSRRIVTYSELHSMSCRIANALSAMVEKGDVVCIYMPMVPEAIASMLACSIIGAVHSVVFSGFSARALADRLNDARAKVLITADGYYRRGKPIELKNSADEALKMNDTVERVIVHEYSNMQFEESSKDVMMSSILKQESSHAECVEMDAEDRLFILYTSGTTGRPKGTVHVHGGFMVFAAQQAAYLVDMKDSDLLFWPADIGWITGQTWSVYGSLLLNCTSLIYDGALDYPLPDRVLRMVDDYNVTILGMAPTALRAIMRTVDDETISRYRLDTLRILACTGEVIHEDEWFWYFKRIGKARCPVINLSGGTEVGGAILSVLPIMPIKPCTVGIQVPGFDADVVDDECRPVRGGKGYLVIRKPWPAMTRGILNDPARYIEVYWSRFNGVWFHGDYASIDEDGLWYLHGRVDDVIKVAGHRFSSADIEAALAMHEAVAESAVVGLPDELKGERIVAYVVLKPLYRKMYDLPRLRDELKRHVENAIGKIARPDSIYFVDDLPKTRSGKVMRRLVRAKALGIKLGDVSSIENIASLEMLDNPY
ncbi:MAG: acetate--CoA ligase [Candidatus Nitrosocaldus sp.]